MSRFRILGLLIASALASSVQAETRAVDPQRSTLTVKVGKTGFFSGLGDEHIVRAPLISGALADGDAAHVEVVVDARGMKVLDPKTAQKKRDEIQTRMLGAEVLDVARFPEIRFRSTKVRPLAKGRFSVEGELTIRDRKAPVTFEVTEESGTFRGAARFLQTTFGIQPITAAGGTIRVKDELVVELEIATNASDAK